MLEEKTETIQEEVEEYATFKKRKEEVIETAEEIGETAVITRPSSKLTREVYMLLLEMVCSVV